jgi:hypothetical protein
LRFSPSIPTLASIAKMTATLRSTRYDQAVDPRVVGRQMFDFVQRHIERIMQFCDGSMAGRIVHVDYYRLVGNPAAVMSDVHAALGIDTPPTVREAVADWHRRNPKNARGVNAYSLSTYGLDEGAVAARFSDYMRRFDIPRERDGLR